MIQPTDQRTGLRPVHAAGVVIAVVVAAVVAYAAFGFIVGTIAFLLKLIVVLAIAAFAVKFVFRHARKDTATVHR